MAEPCKVSSHARELQYFYAACATCLRGTAGAYEAPVLIMCTIMHMGSHAYAIRSLFKTAHLQASIRSYIQVGHTRDEQVVSSFVCRVTSCGDNRGFGHCTATLAVQTMAFRWEKNEAWRNHPMLTNQLRVARKGLSPILPVHHRDLVDFTTPTSLSHLNTLKCDLTLQCQA